MHHISLRRKALLPVNTRLLVPRELGVLRYLCVGAQFLTGLAREPPGLVPKGVSSLTVLRKLSHYKLKEAHSDKLKNMQHRPTFVL